MENEFLDSKSKSLFVNGQAEHKLITTLANKCSKLSLKDRCRMILQIGYLFDTKFCHLNSDEIEKLITELCEMKNNSKVFDEEGFLNNLSFKQNDNVNAPNFSVTYASLENNLKDESLYCKIKNIILNLSSARVFGQPRVGNTKSSYSLYKRSTIRKKLTNIDTISNKVDCGQSLMHHSVLVLPYSIIKNCTFHLNKRDVAGKIKFYLDYEPECTEKYLENIIDFATFSKTRDKFYFMDEKMTQEDSIYETSMVLPYSIIVILKPENRRNVKLLENNKFQMIYPWCLISYSKLKKARNNIIICGEALNLDQNIIAHAALYFEKLVYLSLVDKSNIIKIIGCCLVLSIKLHGDIPQENIDNFLYAVECFLKEDINEIIPLEIPILIALEFYLFPSWEILKPFYKLVIDNNKHHF